MRSDFDPVPLLSDLATKNRLAEIAYLKPTERNPSQRRVEPYRLEASATQLIVVCWQVKPESGWRSFRTDRILSVADGGADFKPRTRITINTGEVFERSPRPVFRQVASAEAYHQALERIFMGSNESGEDLQALQDMAGELDADALRVIHAHLYAQLLQDVIMDGRITEAEEHCLADTRKILDALGWAP